MTPGSSTPGSSRQQGRRVHVLVCGERERGDDAVALLAIDRLKELPAEVEVRRVGQLEPNDLLEVPAGDACVIVDALVGVAPGKIVCGSLASLLEGLGARRGKTTGGVGHGTAGTTGGKTTSDATGKTTRGARRRATGYSSGQTNGNSSGKTVGTTGETIALGSSHSIAPAEVLGLVRELRGELPAGSYVGVGAASFELGASVSEPVASAVSALAEAVLQEARRLTRPDTPRG